MFGLSAASRTLPLGSVVRVTNLDNGRSVVLRVNDRGPYSDILDLSRRAAEVLGIERRGLGLVRIDAL
jgi:rare lipoprotein A